MVVTQCGLKFEYHKLIPSSTAHFHVLGYCKGEKCISFVLSGAAPPTENEPMRVRMFMVFVNISTGKPSSLVRGFFFLKYQRKTGKCDIGICCYIITP
ncbi:unnamed protein product [Allacma fusca]|uniref:Uncharacterized protein n=1 Tax=Allacma fusca TaxID=39272 RepID=A0A8J2K5E1_9HEXA|nr:unnamed protein product [Allacma fusca]